MAAPMDQNYELDLDGLRSNTRFLIDSGLRTGKGVMMSVTAAAECPSLSIEERKTAMKVVADEANGKVPLITSAQDCNINTIIELANYAKETGFDVVQISPPFYYGPSAINVYRLFELVDKKTDIAVMLYNAHWLSGNFSVDIDLMGRLLEIPSVVSFKWSSPDPFCYIEAFKRYAGTVPFLDNTDNPIIGHMHGAKMFLAQPGNFAPKYMINIYELLEKHQYQEVLKEVWKLELPWYKWLGQMHAEGIRGEGATLKASMAMVGLPAGPARPPYDHDLTPDQLNRLRDVFVKAGLKVVK